MKPKPLEINFEEILSKEIDISDAKCELCKKKVEPEVIITGKFTLSKRYINNGNFNSYWHCDNCGAVPAIINGKLSENPLDLMNIPAVRINGEIFISLQRIKSACEFYLKYIHNPKLFFKNHEEYVGWFMQEVGEGVYWRLMDDIADVYDHRAYRIWLFRLAFADVFEKDNGEKDG